MCWQVIPQGWILLSIIVEAPPIEPPLATPKVVKMVTLVGMGAEELVSVLRSKPLMLVASDSEGSIHIHEELISSISPVIDRALKGEWKEATSGAYKFSKDDEESSLDVTEDILNCFVRWAYLGNYSSKIAGISSVVNTDLVKSAETDDDYNWIFLVEDKKDLDSKRKEVPTPSSWPEPGSTTPKEGSQPEEITDLSQSEVGKTGNPLLLHLRIYEFAKMYMIDDLKTVCRRKIIKYLDKVERSSSKKLYLPMVFDLLDYASQHLDDHDHLLDWLACYGSSRLSYLREDMERLDELMEHKNFAALLVKHVNPSGGDPFYGELFR